MGGVIHCRIPLRSDTPQKQLLLNNTDFDSAFGKPIVLPTIHETNFYELVFFIKMKQIIINFCRSLKSSLTHVQMLWELILLNEVGLSFVPFKNIRK